jgi:predicted signal transduction protein with EAL and GGDEF domain
VDRPADDLSVEAGARPVPARRNALTVVAEGVETRDIADQLADLGCERLQGYLFRRPLPRSDLTDLLRTQSVGVAVAASGR